MIYELKQIQVENQLKNVNEQILFFDNVINESPEITNVNLKPILQELKAEKETFILPQKSLYEWNWQQ